MVLITISNLHCTHMDQLQIVESSICYVYLESTFWNQLFRIDSFDVYA